MILRDPSIRSRYDIARSDVTSRECFVGERSECPSPGLRRWSVRFSRNVRGRPAGTAELPASPGRIFPLADSPLFLQPLFFLVVSNSGRPFELKSPVLGV